MKGLIAMTILAIVAASVNAASYADTFRHVSGGGIAVICCQKPAIDIKGAVTCTDAPGGMLPGYYLCYQAGTGEPEFVRIDESKRPEKLPAPVTANRTGATVATSTTMAPFAAAGGAGQVLMMASAGPERRFGEGRLLTAPFRIIGKLFPGRRHRGGIVSAETYEYVPAATRTGTTWIDPGYVVFETDCVGPNCPPR